VHHSPKGGPLLHYAAKYGLSAFNLTNQICRKFYPWDVERIIWYCDEFLQLISPNDLKIEYLNRLMFSAIGNLKFSVVEILLRRGASPYFKNYGITIFESLAGRVICIGDWIKIQWLLIVELLLSYFHGEIVVKSIDLSKSSLYACELGLLYLYSYI
jgi:hypothetical protein